MSPDASSGRPPVRDEPLDSRLTPERLQALVDLWRAAGRRTEIPVEGRSMYPLLQTGWSLVLDHGAVDHPFGCIIVFLQGRALVAHRVVGRGRDGTYLTKGDALLHCDRRWVQPQSILGRVVALRRPAGLLDVDSGWQVFLGRLVAAFSRTVAVLHQAATPLRSMMGDAERTGHRLPGPTRLLGAVNLVFMKLAGSLMGLRQPPREKPEGPASGGGA